MRVKGIVNLGQYLELGDDGNVIAARSNDPVAIAPVDMQGGDILIVDYSTGRILQVERGNKLIWKDEWSVK